METPWTVAKRFPEQAMIAFPKSVIPSTIAKTAAQDGSNPKSRATAITISSLPIEICTEIASYLRSVEILRLTLTCQATYQLFNPSLYCTIRLMKGPDRLFNTLAAAPSLGKLVRSLDIEHVIHVPLLLQPFLPINHEEYHGTFFQKSQLFETLWHVEKVLRSLFAANALRHFVWRSNVPLDVVTVHARPPFRLPDSLVSVSVIPIEAYMAELTRFEFFAKSSYSPTLNYFEYEEKSTETYDNPPVLPHNHYELSARKWRSYRQVFIERLSNISIALTQLSDRLCTLKLTFNLNHPADQSAELQKQLDTIVERFNDLRFPSLQTLVLLVQIITSDDRIKVPDFRPFLLGHPTLTDVHIDLGTEGISRETLPHLKRFEGTLWDSVIIMDSTRPLLALKVWVPYIDFGFPPPFEEGDEDLDEDMGNLLSALSNTHTLRDLSLTPENLRHLSIGKFWGERFMAGSQFIRSVGKACPALCCLELYSQKSVESTLTDLSGFHCLQELNLHIWQWIEPAILVYETDDSNDEGITRTMHIRPATSEALIPENIFSKTQYMAQITRELLPSMPDLITVEIEGLGCLMPAFDQPLFEHPALPQIKISYAFRVVSELDDVRVVRCVS